jgi:ketosteroid isomerase-like protein
VGTDRAGHGAVGRDLPLGGNRFKSGTLVPEDVVSFESGDLAYTVGVERRDVVVDDGPPMPMTIRVTHVYRRTEGEWQLTHRHADFPAVDQRPVGTSTGRGV